jgi:hypothetical protein
MAFRNAYRLLYYKTGNGKIKLLSVSFCQVKGFLNFEASRFYGTYFNEGWGKTQYQLQDKLVTVEIKSINSRHLI